MRSLRWHSLLADRRGAFSLEFAIVGLIFVVLILFITQASMLLWAKAAMQEAASRTARCTAIASAYCSGDPTVYAKAILNDWGISSSFVPISVSVTPDVTCNNSAGHFSLVKIDSTGSGFSGFVSPLSGIVLSSSACYPSGP